MGNKSFEKSPEQFAQDFVNSLDDLDKKINDSLENLNSIKNDIVKTAEPMIDDPDTKMLVDLAIKEANKCIANKCKEVIEICQDTLNQFADFKKCHGDQINESEKALLNEITERYTEFKNQYQNKLKDFVGVGS